MNPTLEFPQRDPRAQLRESLRDWFHPRSVPAFVGCELPIVHEDGATIVADVAVALHADVRPRRLWVSTLEGRPPDVVFYVVAGERGPAIDRAHRQVERGVCEAYVFDRTAGALLGFHRVAGRAAPMPRANEGLHSRALDVHLVPRAEGLRLVHRVASIGELLDVVDRLERALTAIQARLAS